MTTEAPVKLSDQFAAYEGKLCKNMWENGDGTVCATTVLARLTGFEGEPEGPSLVSHFEHLNLPLPGGMTVTDFIYHGICLANNSITGWDAPGNKEAVVEYLRSLGL